jgi:hypothetical protein
MEPLDDVVEVIGQVGMRNVFAASMMARGLALDHTSLLVCSSPSNVYEPSPMSADPTPFDYDEIMHLIAALHDGDVTSITAVDSPDFSDNDDTNRDREYWSETLSATAEIDGAIGQIQ